VLVVAADIGDIADDGWRQIALIAAATGLVVLGAGLIVVASALTPPGSRWRHVHWMVIASIVVVTGAVVVVGVAHEQGDETTAGTDSPREETDEERDLPMTARDALQPREITTSALPIEVQTSVDVELTGLGRELVGEAMDCRLGPVSGFFVSEAIGGTWVQPTLVLAEPFRGDFELIERCRPAVIRLPYGAGVVVPE
jgi:hypothetical protein